MKEAWLRLEEFPSYEISNYGTVYNVVRDVYLTPRINHEGITMLNLSEDRRLYTRSLARLVADNFLEPHPAEHFDTPIHLDGDKTNCRAENLMWRPRWYAVKFHQQFVNPNHNIPLITIRDSVTQEKFRDPFEASMCYGILAKEIFLSVANHDPVRTLGLEIRFEIA